MKTARLVPALLAACMAMGCERQPSPADEVAPQPSASTDPAQTTTPAANPAVREPDAVRQVAPTGNVIASQPGPDGSTWDLTKVRVTGNLLTAQFNVRPRLQDDISYWGEIADISLVDDATAQRYSVVEDQSGRPMVSELGGSSLRVNTRRDEAGTVWIKFPAPPVSSRTVSITLPKVGSFDGVPVSR
jgi:hypothetical protein